MVNEWEIWNEPYGQEKDYAPLLIRTAELIKENSTGCSYSRGNPLGPQKNQM